MGIKERQHEEQRNSQSAANDLGEQTVSECSGSEYRKSWSLHEGMLLFFNKADGSKEWLLYDLRPFLWVWITGHRVTSGGNKRSTAAEVIRETRCQMLMLGNIDSTNVSAKEKPYGGKKFFKKRAGLEERLPFQRYTRTTTAHIT